MEKEIGDFLEEVDNLKKKLVDDSQIIPTASSLDNLLREVEKSDMANGHGQKGTVYREVADLYSTLFHRLKEKYDQHIGYFTSIGMQR